MIEAFFAGQQGLILACLTACAAIASLTYAIGRNRVKQPGSFALFAAAVTATLFLTFSGSSGYTRYTCVLNRDLSEVFLSTQGLLNIALFIPTGFFGLIATRLPLAILAGTAGLSATIEVVQATVPAFARTCDSTDFFANTAGGAFGCLAAMALLRTRGQKPHGFAERKRPIAWVTASILGVDLAIFLVAITPTFVDPTSVQFATSAMKDAAREEVRRAFGDHYHIKSISYEPTDKAVFVGIEEGSIRISWPDRRELNVSLIPYQEGTPIKSVGSFPVPGAEEPESEKDARRIASDYIAQRYPSALKGSEIDSFSRAEERLGWMVSWRRVEDGILMPMRVDVGIDTKGRVSDLLVRDLKDPEELPEPKLNEDEARERAQRDPDLPDGVTEIGEGTLMAKSMDGKWGVVWLFPTGIKTEAGPVVGVNAVDGTHIPEAFEAIP